MPVISISEEEEKVYKAAEIAAVHLAATGHTFKDYLDSSTADRDWDPALVSAFQELGVEPTLEQMQRTILRLRAALLTLGKSPAEIDRIAKDSD